MYKNGYGELKIRILEFLSNSPLTFDDMVDWLMTPGSGSKGSWTGEDRFEFNKRRWRRHLDEERKKAEQKVYSLLYRLEKSGFVKKQNKNGKSYWSRTVKIVKNRFFRTKNFNTQPLTNNLQKIIIIFDISEKEKRKRNWLRYALKNLGYKMLQKSVWLGDASLPREFLEELKNLNLLESVKIFSIFDKGSANFEY